MNLFDLYVSGFLLLILLLVFKFKIIVPTRGYAILILIFSILTLVVATVKTVKGDIETEMENYSQGIANLNNVINLINNNSLTLSSPLPNSNRQVTFNFLNSPVTVYGYHSPEHSNYVPAQGSPAHRSELTGNAALDINRAFNTMVYVRRNLDKAMGRVPMNYRRGGESDERKATFFIKL